jgi:hypothetical protein
LHREWAWQARVQKRAQQDVWLRRKRRNVGQPKIGYMKMQAQWLDVTSAEFWFLVQAKGRDLEI